MEKLENYDGIEGVTLGFCLFSEKFKDTDTLEAISSNLFQPYKHVQTAYDIEAKSKVIWGSIYGHNSHFVVNLRGKPLQLEQALMTILKSYGLPRGIYKANKFFKNTDTEQGVEIAKNAIIKMGGKVKKRGSLALFLCDSDQQYKYSVYKKKNKNIKRLDKNL